ncbi:hypothetical protein ABPG72_022724 [Tetrahymena utriculariae]
MDKQNISSQGQDSIELTKNLLSFNQLSQQGSHPQEFQNQNGSSNIQNELEDINTLISNEETLLKKVKSQIVRKLMAQNKTFQNVMCQIFNQKEAQHVIISYQDQENKNFVQHLSSKNSSKKSNQPQHQIVIQQDKNYPSNNFGKKEDQIKEKQITTQQISNNQINNQKQEKTDKNLQKEEQKLNNEQILKYQQIDDQEKAYKQEINEKQQICDQEKVIEKPYHTEQKNNLKFRNISEKTSQNCQDKNISLQPNLLEKSNLKLKQNEEKQILNIQQQVMENSQEAINCTNKEQNNNTDYLISKNDLQKQNNPTIQQEFQSISNQQQFEIQQNIKNLNSQSQSYSSQLKTIFDKIKEYQFKEYEKSIEQVPQAFQIKREWEQEIFEKIDANKTQSEIFQSQKSKIFERLKQEQYYLCKIIYSNQIEDLILGFQDDGQNINECENVNSEYIFKIIYNSDQVQSNLNSQNYLFETLGFQFKLIKLEKENISIFSLTKNDFLSISETFEQLLNFKQNIQQIENYYEINSQNCQEYEKCGNQKTCNEKNCFKNKKSRILDFLQTNKYFFCEYTNKRVNGIIFQLNQEDLISEYLHFLHKTIFSFLMHEQSDHQNTTQYQSIYFCENTTEKKYNPSLKENNKQINDLDLFNEYSFQEYQVLKKPDQNQEKGNFNSNYYREWDITKFNDLNKNKLSDTFQKFQKDIIQILKNKNYFLCSCFVSNQQEDILIGYHEQIKEKYMDHIFVIKYNPIHSELQKYLLIKQFNEEINHFIINGFVHVLILSKDAFLQIYNNFEQVKIVEWTQDQFEQINKDKIINLKNCNKSTCQGCQNQKECTEYLNFRKFQNYKNTIFQDNNISSIGGIKLGKLLGKCNNLVKLNLNICTFFIHLFQLNYQMPYLKKIFKFNNFVIQISFMILKSKNRLKDNGVSGLADGLGRNQNIEQLILNLQWNKISSKGAISLGTELGKCQNLATLILNLYYNDVTNYGYSALGVQISECSNLKNLTLILSGQIISDEDESCLFQGQKKCQNLKHFNIKLSQNKIINEGFLQFAEGLKKSKNLLNLNICLTFNCINFESRSKASQEIKK